MGGGGGGGGKGRKSTLVVVSRGKWDNGLACCFADLMYYI